MSQTTKTIDLFREMVSQLILDQYDVLSKIETECNVETQDLVDEGFASLDDFTRLIFGDDVHAFYLKNSEVDNSDAVVNPPFNFFGSNWTEAMKKASDSLKKMSDEMKKEYK